MNYKEKVVFITGGSGGIGKATARIFLEKEAKVCISDVNEEEGKRVLEELKKDFCEKNVIYLQCDVTKEEQFESAYRKCENSLGTIDILINNAGVIVKNFRTVIEVIQFGTFIGTELAMKKMGKHNGGKGGFIVNIASLAGVSTHFKYVPSYSSAKAAVVHFSRIFGNEFHQNYSGVSVLCLCPGSVDTPILDCILPFISDFERLYSKNLIPRRNQYQFLKPREAGEAIIKLIDENKSGEVAVIDKKEGFFYVPSAQQEIK